MLRYISIVSSGALVIFMLVSLHFANSHYDDIPIMLTVTCLAFINLLALLKLDAGKGYLPSFFKCKIAENKLRMLEAEIKIDSIQKGK